MSHWPVVPFEEVVIDVSGGNAKTPLGDYMEEGTYPIVDQGQTLVAGYTNEESALCRAPLPVVVFGDHTRCFKFVDFRFGMGADGVKVLRAGPPLDTRFLYHYLRQLRLPDEGYSRHFKYLKRSQVPLPPMQEQRRIAGILDEAETLRVRKRTVANGVAELPQAIFVEMFGDPLRNTQSWPVIPLGALGQLDRGVSKHRPRNAPELLGGPYPLVQTGDVANCEGYVQSFGATYSDVGLKQSRLWPAGTLCITIAANIAKTGILTFDACFPDSVVGFTSDPATTEYVRIWLSFLQKTLEEAAPESAQKNINLAILRNIGVPVPPPSLRADFFDRLREIERVRDLHRAASRQTDALFASLQHRAFSGQL